MTLNKEEILCDFFANNNVVLRISKEKRNKYILFSMKGKEKSK